MILPRMTPEEKLRQMERLLPYAKAIAQRTMNQKNVFKKVTRFPAYVFLAEREITDMGRWTGVLGCDNRSDAVRGRFTYDAFQKYEVRYARKEYNNGIGIYVCHPQNCDKVWCQEFPPHYFFRLRERYISKKGIVQPDFAGLVREMFRLHHHAMNVIHEGTVMEKGEDGMYDVVKTPANQRREGYDNFATYHRDGISLGISAERRYYNYTTFVSNDLLKHPQEEMQRQQVADARNHELKLRYDQNTVFKEVVHVDGEVNFGL